MTGQLVRVTYNIAVIIIERRFEELSFSFSFSLSCGLARIQLGIVFVSIIANERKNVRSYMEPITYQRILKTITISPKIFRLLF